ncbi:MAG: CDP-alcohol phosphatidyltransferase family protein [Armatimonadota bacterium]
MAETRTVQERMITPANLLTFARLVFLPVVIYGIATDQPWVTVGAMAAAWVTDLLDGRIARLMRQGGTLFGKSLDSTVDFAFIYSLFIAYYAANRLATWQFAVLYLAMITILTLQFFLTGSGREEEVASTRLGKPTGALQYAYLLFLAAHELPAVRDNPTVQTIDMIYFAIMAVVIVLNSIECVRLMARLGRGPITPAPA